ncbi:thioredoxin domain-containing protein [uncultured Pseudodesulfovibrio sp.]|uniref:thioredoxin family protein n=1 Tax=uncultured Pseudodesulfovibrio sp. TaxID=2035858 RepID=UPI0029C6742E|nr:thioredoxin domain-containing protein [uncultured Pseudodesulfovibrio sp.]
MTAENRLIVCSNCRAINRVQQGREAEATCGKCKSKIFEPTPTELVGATFDRHITKGDLPILVDFYSPSCGPCLMMGPQFAEAAKQLYPAMRLAKIDTTAETAISARFNIQAVPTLVIFKNGQEIARQPGAMSAPDIVKWAKQFA